MVIWKDYVERVLHRAHEELRLKPTYILHAVNDGTVPVEVLIDLPILPPDLDASAIARSLIKYELDRRRKAAKWIKAKMAALAVVSTAVVTAAIGSLT